MFLVCSFIKYQFLSFLLWFTVWKLLWIFFFCFSHVSLSYFLSCNVSLYLRFSFTDSYILLAVFLCLTFLVKCLEWFQLFLDIMFDPGHHCGPCTFDLVCHHCGHYSFDHVFSEYWLSVLSCLLWIATVVVIPLVEPVGGIVLSCLLLLVGFSLAWCLLVLL